MAFCVLYIGHFDSITVEIREFPRDLHGLWRVFLSAGEVPLLHPGGRNRPVVVTL
jgi:hypothetical protein